jgi:hypothetical protein
MLLKEQEGPAEALEGQGEVQMSEANPDLVQKQLSELAQQIVHVIEAVQGLGKESISRDADSDTQEIIPQFA